MAKTTTHFEFSGASKDSSKSKPYINNSKPSIKALNFVLDYAKSSRLITTKSINPFVFISN
jgi:hypothetical protein